MQKSMWRGFRSCCKKYRDELKFQMESLAFVYTPRRRNSKEKIDLLEKSHALVEDLLQITQE